MASDIFNFVPPECSISRLETMEFMGTARPWLNLYGKRVRPVAPFGSVSRRPFVDPALIHRSLPDELLVKIFERLNPYSLGKAACVCRKWRYTIRDPNLWRSACLKTWKQSGALENYRKVRSVYECSWRKMWIKRPRIRIDGIYVSRNTYLHVGAASWEHWNVTNHMVLYFRYIRFYPNGNFLYKVSSLKVREAVKCMNFRASEADSVFKGDYLLTDEQVTAALMYPGTRTLLRMRLRIRGTTVGANNRLDLVSLVTTSVDASEVNALEDDMLGVIRGWEEDEAHDQERSITHKRGLKPFVFVPFAEAETSFLNLPLSEMDYFNPG